MAAGYPKWMRYFSWAVTITAVLLVVVIFFGRREMMGTRYAVSDKEAVNYSGTATEEEARKLADTLREIGFFDGSRNIDVLLRKEKDKGTIVSFVVNTSSPEIVSGFQEIGGVVADQALGRPLTVRLIDDNLNTQHELRVE